MSIENGYYERRNPNGFGYEVMLKETNPENHKATYNRVFHTSSKEQLKKVLKDFQEKGSTKLVPETNWVPRLLTFVEKHSSPKFLVRSEEELFTIALEVVHDRNQEGWYRYFAEVEPNVQEVTQEEIDVISNPSLKIAAEKERKRFLDEQKELKELIRLKRLLEVAINEKNSYAAFMLLSSTRSAEYEDFQIEDFKNVEK